MLAGHVLGNTIQAVIAVVLVLGVGLLIGFRPAAGPIGWCVVITVAGYAWSTAIYEPKSVR